MAEPLMMVDSSSSVNSKSDEPPKCDMWRIFSDKPITLTELLESSPEAQQLKKYNFNLTSDKRWSQTFSIANRKRNSLPTFNTTNNNNNNSNPTNTTNLSIPFSSNFSSSSNSYPSASPNVSNNLLASSLLPLLNDCGSGEPYSENCEKRKIVRRVVRRAESEKSTKGPTWYNLHYHHSHNSHNSPSSSCSSSSSSSPSEMNAVHLRAALDTTKKFCRRNINSNSNSTISNNLPTRSKYFQVGRILDHHHHQHHHPVEFYHSHSQVPRKQRKKIIAEEMVAEVSSTVSHL